MPTQSSQLGSIFTALRGVIMIMAGVFTLAYPTEALRFLVYVGGGILLLDGLLKLTALSFSKPRDAYGWTDLLRCGFAIMAGLVVILSPFLIPIVSLTVLLYLVGILAIAVGAIEIFELLRPGRSGAEPMWPPLVAGGAYIAFGLLLIFLPSLGALAVARTVAVLMLAYGVSLIFQVWGKLRRARAPARQH